MTTGRALGLGVVGGVVGTVLIAIGAWLLAVYTGAYNVAATDAHADVARWTLETSMRRSVSRRAEALDAPEAASAELIASGGPRYAAMCAHCHAGPGVERAAWATGMRPEPPHLVEAAAHWEPEEVVWIVRNGIKMSGMPAFGPDHGERALLELAAFVKQLPGMTPETYRELTRGASGDGAGHGSAGHGH